MTDSSCACLLHVTGPFYTGYEDFSPKLSIFRMLAIKNWGQWPFCSPGIGPPNPRVYVTNLICVRSLLNVLDYTACWTLFLVISVLVTIVVFSIYISCGMLLTLCSILSVVLLRYTNTNCSVCGICVLYEFFCEFWVIRSTVYVGFYFLIFVLFYCTW